jgi:exodeoxyribonuclease VII large subunit
LTRSGGNTPEFSVSELSSAIKRALEDGFGYVRIKGEVSGYRGPHASGHCYFALKDDKAKIEAVIWKGTFARLKIKPEEGMEVVAQGRITTFPGSSKYQIMIEALEPAGAGALMALLEERKRRMAAEGLFDEARKKPRPFLPKVIGIVTSPNGAVIRDMLHGFNERFPARVIVWPVRVQGDGSADEVAGAIRGFNAFEPGGRLPRPDVLIVARGGGSLEDLWTFNEEQVVRAAAESTIPLISAVGHETDWTLIDLVADARAPTPTKAAEWAVPKYTELVDTIEKLQLRHRTALRRLMEETRAHLRAAARGLPRLEDILALPCQRFDGVAARLPQGLLAFVQKKSTALARTSGRLPSLRSLVRLPRQRFDAVGQRLARGLVANTHTLGSRLTRISGRLSPGQILQRAARARDRLDAVSLRAHGALANRMAMQRRILDGHGKMLTSLSYQSVLARGYALVRDSDGKAVRFAKLVQPGSALTLEFFDGTVDAEAKDSAPSAAPQSRPTRSKTPPSGGPGGGQGTLF